jgi:hypothetical protein
MSLAEVIVAAAVFLGACSGAAQMGASSAEAMTQQRQQAQQLEQIEAQFVAVAPLLRAARSEAPEPGGDCAAAAQWMQAALEAALPPLEPGLNRQLSLSASGEQLQLTVAAGGKLQRQRLYSPAAFGLCGAPAAETEPGDAAL